MNYVCRIWVNKQSIRISQQLFSITLCKQKASTDCPRLKGGGCWAANDLSVQNAARVWIKPTAQIVWTAKKIESRASGDWSRIIALPFLVRRTHVGPVPCCILWNERKKFKPGINLPACFVSSGGDAGIEWASSLFSAMTAQLLNINKNTWKRKQILKKELHSHQWRFKRS